MRNATAPNAHALLQQGYALAMGDINTILRAVMAKSVAGRAGGGKAKAFAGKETQGEEALEAKGGAKPERTMDRKAQSADFTKRPMKDAGRGTAESNDKATAPRAWQSSPDHETALLAYITPTEGDMLRKADVHGSGVDKKMHYGPKGVPSFQGDGPGGGGSTDSSAGDNSQGATDGMSGTRDAGEPDGGWGDGLASDQDGDGDADAADVGLSDQDDRYGPEEAYGPQISPEAIRDQEEKANTRAQSISDRTANARSAGVFGGLSQTGFHAPGMARDTQDDLAALGIGAGEDKLGIGPSVRDALARAMSMAPVANIMAAQSPLSAIASFGGMVPGAPVGMGFAADLATGERGGFGEAEGEAEGTGGIGDPGGPGATGGSMSRGMSSPLRDQELNEAISRVLSNSPSMPRMPSRYVGGVQVAPGFGGDAAINPGALRAVLMGMGRPYPSQRSLR